MHKPIRLASLLVLLTVSPLHAAEGEGGLLSIESGLMVWTVLIFLIVLALLYKFAYPHILGAVEAREERIRELLASAERDRAEAAALVEQGRREMDEARGRIQGAIAESRTEVERMKEEILAEARREQDAMLARARRDIAAEREAALDAVRRDAVELAMSAAEKLVRRNLDGEDNRRLVREYLGQVSGSAVPAGV
ncbi:MAG TPA: F0F1 ATP synthase subunit B [Longimicrobiaceae bacterium]|nr:F0F1 ATP synthase subunit B [Longimicrobiaceae bacterium]